ASWFESRGQRDITLRDLAGSEGVLGLGATLTVALEELPEITTFLLAFERREDALSAALWIADEAAGGTSPKPANVKFFSSSHLHHVRRVWQDEDARAWHSAPSGLSDDSGLPWSRIVGPA